MKKRLLALILGTVMTASLIAGCGGGSAGKDSAGKDSAASADTAAETEQTEEEESGPVVEAEDSADAPKDERTLVVHLSKPDSGFPAVVTSPIVPADAEDLASEPIGTGPFVMSEFVEQDYTLLTRNEDYWGEPANLDSVTLKYFENTSSLATNYLSGAIDGFNSNAGGWKELEGTDYVRNLRHSNAVQLLALNNEFEPFKDVRVRQAVAYAVDSEEIIDKVSYGLGTKAGTPVIPGLEKYFNDELTDVYDVNIEKAKELLKEAGQENLTFKIRVPSNYQVHVDTGQVIANQLAKAGIKVEIESVDWNTWLNRVYKESEFEATIVAVDGPIAYPTSFLNRYVSTASDNFVNFHSDAFDETYGKALLETDDAEQVKLFKEAQKIISDECASVYIQDIDSVVINSPAFAGFKAYPLYVDDYSALYAVGDDGKMKKGGDFIKGVSTEAPGFDPFTTQTADARSIFFNIYEGLMRTDTDGSFSPAIAEKCEVSDDLQTYTFTLREGIKFHNGNELTMDDVVYSLEKSIVSGINGFNEIDQFSAGGKKYSVTYPEE